ncbi:MAG: LPP20 family lipoprotein [Halorhodospira sp.]
MPVIRSLATLSPLTATFVVLLTACSSTPEDPDTADEGSEASSRHGLPGWYVERATPDEPMVIYGFGASQAEPNYPDQMRRQARTNAAAEIAEQLSQTVQALNSEYFDRQDLGREEEEARTRQQVQQTTEQWVDQTLIGVKVARSDVTEEGRWVVMSEYDLEQDFDAYFQAIGADEEGLRSDLRSSAQEHLERLRDRVGQ